MQQGTTNLDVYLDNLTITCLRDIDIQCNETKNASCEPYISLCNSDNNEIMGTSEGILVDNKREVNLS